MTRYWGIPASLLMLCGSLASPVAAADLKGNLIIEIEGMRNQTGLLCLKIFSGARGFPNSNESAIKRQCVKIATTPVKLTFADLKAGSYAVAVFHDSNSDRTLNRNALGIPTEGYGFSKNPLALTGPPKFGEAVFLVAGPNTSIKIRLRYPD